MASCAFRSSIIIPKADCHYFWLGWGLSLAFYVTKGELFVVRKEKSHLYVFASVGKSKLLFGVVRLLSIHIPSLCHLARPGIWRKLKTGFPVLLCFLCHFPPLKYGTYVFKRNLGYPSSWPSWGPMFLGYSSLFFIFQNLILHYIMARVYHCTYKKNEEKCLLNFYRGQTVRSSKYYILC